MGDLKTGGLSPMSETSVAVELFLRWLNETQQRGFRIEDSAGCNAIASDGTVRLAVEVRALLGPTEDAAWLSARERLEEQIAGAAPGAIALWVPPGAQLPAGEPVLSEFIDQVRQAAVKLGPHERAHVPLPIKLILRKTSEGGNVVSVTGGLNPHWARFTERVRGTFDLDSTRLHRLPESEEHLEGLLDAIVERSSRLEAGQFAEIETVDSWTVQRIDGEGVTIVGVPPAETQDAGLAVRRNLRRILGDDAPALRAAKAELKALVLLGHYARMEDEGATIAMRGFAPSLYSGLEYVCLVADGLVKPLIAAAPTS
jgi:hypothetical protein